MSTTYTDLVNNIKAFSGRTDPQTLNAIPTFIAAAQTQLDSTLRIPAMLVTQSIEAAGLTIPLPLLKLETLVIGERDGVLHPYADILAARKLDVINQPAVYAINGSNIELVVPADLILTGYQKPARISSGVATNAYTDQAENALLWASLKYLGVFARDSEAAQSWGSMADVEVENLNAAAEDYQSATGVVSEPKRRYF